MTIIVKPKRKKDIGFLGPLKLKGGRVATEYSIGIPIKGKETEIPTLVPTLSSKEIKKMVEEVIPSRKRIPAIVIRKAGEHAEKRIKEGKNPFYSSSEDNIILKPTIKRKSNGKK